jgi:hypothetical protein
LHWAHRHVHAFPDGQLFLNLRGSIHPAQPIATAVAIRRLLESLGVGVEALPNDPDAQSALLRSLLAGRPRAPRVRWTIATSCSTPAERPSPRSNCLSDVFSYASLATFRIW